MACQLESLYLKNKSLFESCQADFKIWEHEPILDFKTDQKVAEQFHWTAAPTKSLFLKVKDGSYALFFTHRDRRLNGKLIKKILGKRVSICADEEMTITIGCQPGAVGPFILPSDITLLVDPILFDYSELTITPGKPTFTFSFSSSDLLIILNSIPNKYYLLPSDHTLN